MLKIFKIKVVLLFLTLLSLLSCVSCSLKSYFVGPGSNISIPCPTEIDSLDIVPKIVLIDPSGKVDPRIQKVENLYLNHERSTSLHATTMAELVLVCAPEAEITAIAPGVDGIQYGRDVTPSIKQAIELNPDVILMGFGTPINSEPLKSAVAAAERSGIIVVSPAGNTRTPSDKFSYDNTPQFYWNEPIYPAAYQTVIAVGALDKDSKSAADYSQDQDYVDVYAPGTLTLSSKIYTNITLDGTSYAAAQVAAVVGLAAKLHPDATPHLMRQAISSTGNTLISESQKWDAARIIHSDSIFRYLSHLAEVEDKSHQ